MTESRELSSAEQVKLLAQLYVGPCYTTYKYDKECNVGDFTYRLVNACLASEMLPASLRTRVMRALGFDMSKTACIWPGANLRSKKMSLGDSVFINVGFYHDGCGHLRIDDNVRLGPYVRVITASHEIGPPDQRCTFEVTPQPVTIGRGCWIGANVVIMPGVTIAPGCVIAASAVVYQSTVMDGVYAGIPARRVRDI